MGGFLVAAAAVGVFAAYLNATSGPDHSWVVVTEPVTAGQQLEPHHLGLVGIDLPTELQGRAFVDPEEVIGAVATAPIAEYDLVLATHLVDGRGAGHEHMSFSIDPAEAVAGRLQPGDRVDVLATYRGDEGTEQVGADVLVLDVDDGSGGIADGGDLVLTVALEPGADTLALAHAASQADLRLVRVTSRDATTARDP